jgi:hypothetical protein
MFCTNKSGSLVLTVSSVQLLLLFLNHANALYYKNDETSANKRFREDV